MSSKGFIVMVVLAVAFGGALAGAFIGGTMVGEGRSETQAAAMMSAPVAMSDEAAMSKVEVVTPEGGGDMEEAMMKAMMQAGANMSEQDAQQMRDQIRSMAAKAVPPVGAGGITGTVTSVDGSLVTVDTPEGLVTVTLDDETTVHQVADMGREQLEAGSRVTVGGTRVGADEMNAQTITVVPEGFDFPTTGMDALPDMFSMPGTPEGGIDQTIIIKGYTTGGGWAGEPLPVPKE